MNENRTAAANGPALAQDANALLKAADRQLRQDAPDAPEAFVTLLLGRAATEDLVCYQADELAAIAQRAWDFLSARLRGEIKVRVEAAPIGRTGAPQVSIVEIVNDDMPFLLDSVMGEITARGFRVHLVAHPILSAQRANGRLAGAPSEARGKKADARESFIHIHIDRIDGHQSTALAEALADILGEVRICVADWPAMQARVAAVIGELRGKPGPLPRDEVGEAVAFLEWLAADNFTLLGVRDYAFGKDELVPVPESGLGLLRRADVPVLQRGGQVLTITPRIRAFFAEPRPLIVTKANMRSRVHRRAYLDYVGVKRFDADGKPSGEFRVVGLFTSTAYTQSMRSIPYLRRKIDAVLARAGFDPNSHSGKALANVLETYPRDELFQLDDDTLYEFALAIMQLDERPRVRVLPYRDRFDRFVSVLVFVPRERYHSGVRSLIGDYLAEAYDGHVSAFHPFFLEGPLTRVHFVIGRAGGETPHPDRAVLEEAVAGLVRTWDDALTEALAEAHEPEKARALIVRYRDAFSDGYRETYSPLDAIADIGVIEGLSAERPFGVDFYHRVWDQKQCLGLKIWTYARPIALSDRVPVLEHMGFRVVDEQTFRVTPGVPTEPGAFLHDMMLERADGQAVDLAPLKAPLQTCFIMVMRGLAEDDGYNALVLAGGLGWRDVALVRTISRFLRQIRVAYSQSYMWATVRKHAAIVARIVALFHTRFDPRIEAKEREQRETELRGEIETALAAVDVLDEDRILRHFANAVQAAIRTNFFQLGKDGQPKSEIAVKFDSRKVDGMPLPRPLYEIFIYSPRFEAIHLRFGKVARGGIRWSDRPQDFRTEILGLVKAQQVKNAVIVPVGAKGGFVPKQIPPGAARDAMQAEGVATYRLFMTTLLELTDNLDGEHVVHPEGVVRHDSDDPYLVVAADKGTATFSDIANEIAIVHKFWLGDAFASGGSAGYDHKAMGITARGAWESVKRHFRELDVDITRTPFTCVGVGDMSGDVFGNGMLREKTTKLIAAFDHRDIFIDPQPDPERSFVERKRLFDLPRSSWQDYDKKLISKGGGVFSRSLKEISLSKEAQAALGFDKGKATPFEVMNAILKAPVDLLFFGGIGTYVRASTEADEQVGDRANDAIRATGAELRCKVIGEGANLGVTQRGRIEAALKGRRLNTDAIDNSAGVNTSDIEVNLKIALSVPVRDGRLSLEARNALLHHMTDEVASLVLRNNYLQTLALSLAERRGLEELGFQQRLMQILEQRGALDRKVEFLPDDMELTERQRRSQPLTRPELSVLLAYAKLSLFSELLDSDVPDDPYLARELGRYFPRAVTEKFPDALQRHRLRREIIATQLANSMINRGGPALTVRIADQTGAFADRIAKAFAAVRDSYDMPALNDAINALDGKVAGAVQLDMYAAVQNLLLDRMVFVLRNVDLSSGLADVVERTRAGIRALADTLEKAALPAAIAARDARAGELKAAGVPERLARRIAELPLLAVAPDLVLMAERSRQPVAAVAATYFAAQAYFRLDQLIGAARGVPVADYFDRLALDRALDAIGDAERRAGIAMMATGRSGEAAVRAWLEPRKEEAERIRSAIQQITGGKLTLSKLTVAASFLSDLAKG